MLDMYNKVKDYYRTPTEANDRDTEEDEKIIPFVAKFGLITVLAFFLLINSFYMLSESEAAVITTFGTPSTEMSPGLHVKMPLIQKVHKFSKNIIGMSIGYSDESDEENEGFLSGGLFGSKKTDSSEDPTTFVRSESEMITKDFNFVNVDFYIEYQLTDPIEFYNNKDTAEEILKNLAQSYIRDTVGIYNVDDVITTGKAEIQSKIKEQLSIRLENEKLGLGIYNVSIQDAEPPTDAVNAAFKAVEDAKQGMDTAMNEAKKYQSEQLPVANAKADKTKRDAEAYKQQRISEAEGQVARFEKMYEEYQKYPLITKKRMFYETMEEMLPELKVIIDSTDGTQKLLPLDPFTTAAEQ